MEAAGRCPVRKLVPPDETAGGPDVERVEDGAGRRVVVRSFDLVREVLRDEEGFHQAGFGADTVLQGASRIRPPVLYLEGPEHRAQRRAAARFFTPKAVEDYRPMMEALSERLVGEVRPDRAVDLSELSLRMAVEVAARVVGLTDSSLRGMTRRLDAFFEGDPMASRVTLRTLPHLVKAQSALWRFYWFDVKPAIRARRRQPREDVMSQILAHGFSDLDVLTECVTYGAAGMVTTREFITVGAWHLLEDPALAARFRSGDREERTRILQETLRLEPVVGHLMRRATRAKTLTGADATVAVAAGDIVDLDVRAANADPRAVGEEPLGLCPERSVGKGVPPSAMSLGDGHHRCPGGPIAVMEAEVFLAALFRREVVADGPPQVRWNPVTLGYDLDGFQLRLSPSSAVPVA